MLAPSRSLASRLLALALSLAAVALLSGCSSGTATSPERHAFTLNLTGMAPHVGQRLDLRIVHRATMNEVARARVATIPSASFQLIVPDALVAGETYHVDFYADFNRNGRYDAPPADHAWRRVVNAPAAPVSITFMHDANFTDIRWP